MERMTDRASITRSQALLGAMLLVAWVLFLTWDAWCDMIATGWRDEEASHVLLVPVIMIWTAWVRRRRLRLWAPGGSWVGAVVLGVGTAVWWYGDFHQYLTLWHGGSVAMLAGAVLLVGGTGLLVHFAPVFGVMLFFVPPQAIVRQHISVPLQTLTAQLTEQVCVVLGLDVIRHGNVLVTNGTSVAVAEGCNGMRMVFTLLCVAYAYAFTTPLYTYARLIILMASPVLAIVCNLVRLVPTVWIFGKYDPSTAQRFHDLSGWAMLLVAYLLLSSIVGVLKWAELPVSPFRMLSIPSPAGSASAASAAI